MNYLCPINLPLLIQNQKFLPWALFQSLSPASSGDAGGLRHQFRRRTTARLHIRRSEDQRPSLLQVHTAGGSI